MHKRSLVVLAAAAALVATGSMGSAAAATDDESGRSSATSSLASRLLALPKQLLGQPVPCVGVLVLGDAPQTKVVVPDGASCTLLNSTVKSVRGLPGSVDVKVLDTNVKRNVMVRGATGDVHIGDSECGYDPEVGNNVIVRNSHNVLICTVSAKNNIIVRGNDGRITVRDNVAGRHIMVNRNLAFAPHADEDPPSWAGAIRILHNEAGNSIVARDNDPSRNIVTRGNSPAVTIA